MKILHVIFLLLPGGAESMLVDIVNEQASRGHDVELLIVNSHVNADLLAAISPQVRVTCFGRKEGSAPLMLMARLNLFALRRNPDIIHLHAYKLPGLLRVMRSRTLYTVHAPRTSMKYTRGVKMTAISEAVRDDVLKSRPEADITVIPNGINVPQIVRRQPERELAKPVRIVQVGRLDTSIKGQDILIEAVAILKKRGIDTTVNFIGSGPDRTILEDMAKGLGISDKVTFEGLRTRPEIYSHLCDFDIMCHPSRYEGFGLTVAEGMAAGLPVAVTEGDGPWELADNGRLCKSFPAEDPEACADALEAIIKDYSSALVAAEEGIRHVNEHYSVARMVDDFEKYYLNCCNK